LNLSKNSSNLLERTHDGTGEARFSSLHVRPLEPTGKSIEIAYPGCDIGVECEIRCVSKIADANAAVIFYDANGFRLIDTNTAQKGMVVSMAAGQTAHIRFLLHDVLLKPGMYFIGLWLGRHNIGAIDHVEQAATLEIMESAVTKLDAVSYPGAYLCRFENEVSIS